MVSEVLYDSIVVAGHLTEYKWSPGENIKTYSERVRVAGGVLQLVPNESAGLDVGAMCEENADDFRMLLSDCPHYRRLPALVFDGVDVRAMGEK